MLKGTALMGFHETNKLSCPVGIKLVHPQVYWVIIGVWAFEMGFLVLGFDLVFVKRPSQLRL